MARKKLSIILSNSAKSWGGNERWTTSIANVLHKQGHNIQFLHRTDIFEGKLERDITTHKLPFKHEFDRKTSKYIKNIITQENIDIAIPTKRKEYSLLGRLCYKKMIPCIFRLGIKRKLNSLDFYQKNIYSKFASGIIVNAQAIKEQLLSDGIITNPDKIHVVYNGYLFDSQLNNKMTINIPKNKYIFASAGRLTSQKGFDLFIDAIAKLSMKRNDFYVIIAGEGGDRHKLETAINDNGLNNFISLPGNIDFVRELFSKSDCVVLPSRREGIANALFEAWSVKTPVICSDSSGFPEVIEHGKNGLMFKLYSEREDIHANLANALEYAIDNDISHMGAEGFRRLNDDFTIAAMCRNVEDVLYEYTGDVI